MCARFVWPPSLCIARWFVSFSRRRVLHVCWFVSFSRRRVLHACQGGGCRVMDETIELDCPRMVDQSVGLNLTSGYRAYPRYDMLI